MDNTSKQNYTRVKYDKYLNLSCKTLISRLICEQVRLRL